MAIQKNIGKNTIGDNNKMSVSLHDYNMSTHDLSTILRNTQSPGALVPNLCLVTLLSFEVVLLVPYSDRFLYGCCVTNCCISALVLYKRGVLI